MDRTVQSVVKTAWWLVLLRGIFTALFGIIALVSPGIALLSLVWVFGVYAIVDGIAAVALGIQTRGEPHCWLTPAVGGQNAGRR